MEIFEFSDSEINRLAFLFQKASENDQRVRFSIHNGLVQFKRAEGIWSAPMGHKEKR